MGIQSTLGIPDCRWRLILLAVRQQSGHWSQTKFSEAFNVECRALACREPTVQRYESSSKIVIPESDFASG